MAKIKDIREINIEFEEGKLLLAALALITTEIRRDKTTNDVLQELQILQKKMFDDGN